MYHTDGIMLPSDSTVKYSKSRCNLCDGTGDNCNVTFDGGDRTDNLSL